MNRIIHPRQMHQKCLKSQTVIVGEARCFLFDLLQVHRTAAYRILPREQERHRADQKLQARKPPSTATVWPVT